MYHLTVTEPFGKYVRGSHITDPKEVEAVISGPNKNFVVKRFPAQEHADGSFYKSDAELRAPKKPAPAPVTVNRA